MGVVVTILFGVNYYVYRRLTADFGLERRGKTLLVTLLAGGVVLMIVGRALEKVSPTPFVQGLGVLSSVIVLGAIVTFALLLVHGLLRGILRRLRTAMRDESPSESISAGRIEHELGAAAASEAGPIDAPIDAARRDLLTTAAAAGAVVLGGGSSAYAALVGRHDYTIEEVPIRLARLNPVLDGYTIVQLSDLHVGLDIGDDELAAALQLVREARPDHIVLTGDLLDHDVRFADQLGRFVRQLGERAEVSAVIGNHDYYAGVHEITRVLRRAGAHVLVNESRLIEQTLVLGGVDDVWARRQDRPGRGPDAALAFAGTDPDLARVLLCHNPSYYPEAADHADLQLSGHTHGGQFSPLVNPARLVLRHGYIRGRYERARTTSERDEAPSQLYVNRGFGTAGPPARIGSPPEVTKIVLTT